MNIESDNPKESVFTGGPSVGAVYLVAYAVGILNSLWQSGRKVVCEEESKRKECKDIEHHWGWGTSGGRKRTRWISGGETIRTKESREKS